MPTFAARDLANTFTQTQTVPALTSAGALPISAGGTNQDITLTPSGTGKVVLPSENTNTVLAGPSAYGAAAAAPAARALVVQDIPPQALAAFDNQILTSAVDANGNPAFLTAGAGLTLNILGATTPLVLFNHGKWQTLNSDVTLTLADASNQFVYAIQDTANAALVAADFGASALPPDYDYVAPAAAATDQHWFDLAHNQMYRYDGAAWAAVSRIFLGVARTDGGAITAVVCEPYRLSPQRRFELFGDASDEILTVTGATTVDGYKNYSFVRIDGAAAVLTHSVPGTTTHSGLRLRSQNPILVINAGTINVNAKGHTGKTGTIGAGAAGNWGGLGVGGGGGGGGAGATNAGGVGGAFMNRDLLSTTWGAGAGGAVKTAGSAGTPALAAAFWEFLFTMGGVGAGAGAGGGDGTRKGGDSGRGGGSFVGLAPAWLIHATSSITANGTNGSPGENAGADDAGGGGGGGSAGGIAVVGGGYVNNLGTISATGGAGGAGGTNHGAAGGAGGAGAARAERLW